MGRGSFAIVIRLIAGAYIIYLGYQLINGYLNPTEETGDPAWYAMVFGIAFIVIGAFLIIDVIRRQAAKPQEEEEEGEEDQDADKTEEIEASEETSDKTEAESQPEIPHTMTIAERIKRLSADDEEDEDADDEDEAEADEEASDESEEADSTEEDKNE